jgi:hypothetical protein
MGRLPSRRDNHAKTVLLRPRGKISRRGGSAVRAHHMRFHLYAEITQLFDCPADNGQITVAPHNNRYLFHHFFSTPSSIPKNKIAAAQSATAFDLDYLLLPDGMRAHLAPVQMTETHPISGRPVPFIPTSPFRVICIFILWQPQKKCKAIRL